MNYWLITIPIALALAYVIWRKYFRLSELERRVNAALKNGYTTNSGVTFGFENEINYRLAGVIHDALSAVFVRAKCSSYRRSLGHGDYTVVILEPAKIHNGQPVLKAEDKQYNGTEYDQGDHIFVAGQFLPKLNVIAIADPVGMSPEYIAELITHEATHKILYDNDRQRYEATKTHTGVEFGLPEC